MYKKRSDGKTLYCPNGIWGRYSYVFPDESYRRRLAWLLGITTILLIILFIASAIYVSWLVLIVGAVSLHLAYYAAIKYMCRNLERVEEGVSFSDSIKDYASRRKFYEFALLLIVSIFIIFRQTLELFSGSDEVIYDSIGLLFFVYLAFVSAYAIYSLRKP